MSIIKLLPLERAASLDWKLTSRFPRRELDRLVTALGTQRHTGTVGTTFSLNQEQPAPQPTALAGLEVTCGAGSSAVTVTPGLLLATTNLPESETRPSTWSGILEPDDYFEGLYTLVTQTNAAPSTIISSGNPTTAQEWWGVYALPKTTVVETNTQAQVYNPTTGTLTTAPETKVAQHQVQLSVLRGAPGGGLPTPPLYAPTGNPLIKIPAPTLAWLLVPAGATDLANALVFDVRHLYEPGPNEIIAGNWTNPTIGPAVAPYTAIAWTGSVTARIGHERVSVRSNGLTLTQLLDPTVTWDNSASPSAPKVAYLYLAKPQGFVPRAKRVGATVLGANLSLSEGTMIEGSLVLSSTPPIGGNKPSLPSQVALTESGFLWDLRPSATLGLPAPFFNGTGLPADSLCIGVMLYTGVDTVNNVPWIVGPILGDSDGWFRGDGISQATQFNARAAVNGTPADGTPGNATGNAAHPLVPMQTGLRVDNESSSGAVYTLTGFGSAFAASLPSTFTMPVDEVELTCQVSFLAANPDTGQLPVAPVTWGGANADLGSLYPDFLPLVQVAGTSGSLARFTGSCKTKATLVLPGAGLYGGIPAQPAFTVTVGGDSSAGSNCNANNSELLLTVRGIRWPWRRALVT